MTPEALRDSRRVITAAEAQVELGIPAGTVRSWASRRKLFAVSVGPDGARWYSLAELLALAAGRWSTATRPAQTEILANRHGVVQH